MSGARKVYAANAAALNTGEKNALLIPRTVTDRHQLNGDWHGSEAVAHDTVVGTVEHMTRYQTTAGDLLAVYDDGTWQFAAFARVKSIRATDSSQLTEAEARALGYASRAALQADSVRGMMWWIDVEKVEGTES